MAWCFSTRASVATVLIMQSCVSRHLWIQAFKDSKESTRGDLRGTNGLTHDTKCKYMYVFSKQFNILVLLTFFTCISSPTICTITAEGLSTFHTSSTIFARIIGGAFWHIWKKETTCYEILGHLYKLELTSYDKFVTLHLTKYILYIYSDYQAQWIFMMYLLMLFRMAYMC